MWLVAATVTLNSNREKKMANISEFKANMIGGGARANQFRVALQFPSYVGAGLAAMAKAPFLCKAASLPASTIDNIPVQYMGRNVNFAGERTFAPWTVTVLNDVDFIIRRALESWSNGIQQYDSTLGITAPLAYQQQLSVIQLDRSGIPLREYSFHDAYPTDISDIPLSFESANQIEEFTVTFNYNYFSIDL